MEAAEDNQVNEEGDEIVTLKEFLDDEEQAADEIASVISASDPKNCSYDQGYVPRQAIFVCQTCVPADAGAPGGVCLACSLICHEGHEQLVLYTKRHFRCDCGNSKFADTFSCRHRPDKEKVNPKNAYGHNFQGLYCTCDRPYPDPDDDVEDEMIQCCVCEDWYHSRHLSPPLESADEYCELVCQVCTGKHPFLHFLASEGKKEEKVADDEKGENGAGGSGEHSPPAKRARPSPLCLSALAASPPAGEPRRVLLPDQEWRRSLCRCDKCQALLATAGLAFLADADDSVSRYEARGRARNLEAVTSTEQKVADMWNGMDRFRQMEVGSRLSSFRSQLQDFFAEYQKEGKVVTKEAVSSFFQSVISKDVDTGIPKSCTYKP